jgi:hypothetical protein
LAVETRLPPRGTGAGALFRGAAQVPARRGNASQARRFYDSHVYFQSISLMGGPKNGFCFPETET